MGCEDCKGRKDQKFFVYLQIDADKHDNVAYRQNIINGLMEELSYITKQAETIYDIACDKGECLIYKGSQDIVTKLIPVLVMKGIMCEARNK